MKKLFAILVLVGVALVSQTRAANLSAAAGTLPTNEEWSLMARSSIDQHAGQNYLRDRIGDASALDLEKRILAITAQGQNPRTFGEENFVDKLMSKFDGSQMGDPSLLNDDIFGLLALKSAGENGEVISKLRSHILGNQNGNGGWSFSAGGNPDSNTTAMAVAALKSSGSVPGNAISYLSSAQNSDGGYGFTPSMDSDGASTSWVIIGLRSAGSVPTNAISYLESLQASNGSFKWKASDSNGSSLVTSYAVIALSGKSLPIRTVSGQPVPPPPAPQPVTPPPAPNPLPPAPALNPVPQPPAPNPVPPPPAPIPNPQPPSPTPYPTVSGAATYLVTISHPGNIIYVGNVTLSGAPKAIETLTTAAKEINLLYQIKDTSFGPFVHTINGYAPAGSSGWQYAVNGSTPSSAASDYVLQPGDRVQWFFGTPNALPY